MILIMLLTYLCIPHVATGPEIFPVGLPCRSVPLVHVTSVPLPVRCEIWLAHDRLNPVPEISNIHIKLSQSTLVVHSVLVLLKLEYVHIYYKCQSSTWRECKWHTGGWCTEAFSHVNWRSFQDLSVKADSPLRVLLIILSITSTCFWLSSPCSATSANLKFSSELNGAYGLWKSFLKVAHFGRSRSKSSKW